MTQAKPRFSTFEEYLNYDDGSDRVYEWIDGELVELPPESEPNTAIAQELFWLFATAQIVSRRLIKLYACQLQVPVIESGDAANRFPDFVVLREEHLALTQSQLTITSEMPPPILVAEIVSPGDTNSENYLRDYVRKRAQYAARGIPEYWLIDPTRKVVIVLYLEREQYREVGQFREKDRISSPTFPDLTLMAAQILAAGR
ncbi:Uma2 family endonuclease [Leptolyngbya sp. FACHB-17]|uniref:Uma2 family endonuclease n=1 Tax=unclassified Leptolyngbya TaxID=2650499 RepID=UPI001680AC13|nr:Uma2 family endonuclease [Leptolyngbya sp. FACHB-17]MBD2079092.1 Uma2 family endonuclease [Leptolyngbya sp. FACHB-17]